MGLMVHLEELRESAGKVRDVCTTRSSNTRGSIGQADISSQFLATSSPLTLSELLPSSRTKSHCEWVCSRGLSMAAPKANAEHSVELLH